jgi:hypothetical protein
MVAMDEMREDVNRAFRDPFQALMSLGWGPTPDFLGARKSALSVQIPMKQRVEMLDLELRGQLHLLADQVSEFDGPVRDNLESEALAVVIALCELWRHFPDVFPGRYR